MEGQKVMVTEDLLNYEAPKMEKHDPIKAVQGSGNTYYCYYVYNYYYGYYYYYC
jgi:hypothetical protein